MTSLAGVGGFLVAMGLVKGYNEAKIGVPGSEHYCPNLDRWVGPLVQVCTAAERWAVVMSTVGAVTMSDKALENKYSFMRWYFGCRDEDLLVEKEQEEGLPRALQKKRKLQHNARQWLDKAYTIELHDVNQRNAERVLEALLKNGGIYIKAGQFASTSLRGVIPDEYVDTLAVLQDSIPSIPYVEVKSVVEKEFGRPIDEVFSAFQQEPLAAASLGQVHQATLRRDGSSVAVKVQYPKVRKYLPGDLFTIKQVLRIYWFNMPEKQREANLEQLDSVSRELDFELEANNMRRSKRELQNIKSLYIPTPVDDMVTPHLLLMEFIDNAVRVSDVKGIKALGIDPSTVGAVLSQAFTEQIFVHGFVHCDPHPGNILVRKDPKNPREPQVVLLDHGLYQEMSSDFRMRYLKFWLGILRNDQEAIVGFCDHFGIRHPDLFLQMLTFQFVFDTVDLDLKTSEDGTEIRAPDNAQMDKWKQRLSNMSFSEMNDWRQTAENFPPELRLVMRNQMLSAGVNQLLGARIDRFAIQARVIRDTALGETDGFKNLSVWERLKLDARIRIWSLLNVIVGWFLGWFLSSPKSTEQSNQESDEAIKSHLTAMILAETEKH